MNNVVYKEQKTEPLKNLKAQDLLEMSIHSSHLHAANLSCTLWPIMQHGTNRSLLSSNITETFPTLLLKVLMGWLVDTLACFQYEH